MIWRRKPDEGMPLYGASSDDVIGHDGDLVMKLVRSTYITVQKVPVQTYIIIPIQAIFTTQSTIHSTKDIVDTSKYTDHCPSFF